SLQMVAFVLHDSGMKSFHGTIYGPAILVRALIAQFRETGHHPAHAGNTQATFPTGFHFLCKWCQHWIHQNSVRHFLRIRIAWIMLDAEYRNLKADTNLWRSQTRAIKRLHGLPHILNQGMERGCAEVLDLLGHLQQARVTHFQYW